MAGRTTWSAPVRRSRNTRVRPGCRTVRWRTRSASRRTTSRSSRRGSREGDVAAVILEPTGASWGTLPIREEFLAGLRELTSRHNTVLIFDEVVTGFRVSPGGVQARYGVTPDVTTLAKILAGGLPGGAVAGKADILSMLEFRDDAGWNAGMRVAAPGHLQREPSVGSGRLDDARRGGYGRAPQARGPAERAADRGAQSRDRASGSSRPRVRPRIVLPHPSRQGSAPDRGRHRVAQRTAGEPPRMSSCGHGRAEARDAEPRRRPDGRQRRVHVRSAYGAGHRADSRRRSRRRWRRCAPRASSSEASPRQFASPYNRRYR